MGKAYSGRLTHAFNEAAAATGHTVAAVPYGRDTRRGLYAQKLFSGALTHLELDIETIFDDLPLMTEPRCWLGIGIIREKYTHPS